MWNMQPDRNNDPFSWAHLPPNEDRMVSLPLKWQLPFTHLGTQPTTSRGHMEDQWTRASFHGAALEHMGNQFRKILMPQQPFLIMERMRGGVRKAIQALSGGAENSAVSLSP